MTTHQGSSIARAPCSPAELPEHRWVSDEGDFTLVTMIEDRRAGYGADSIETTLVFMISEGNAEGRRSEIQTDTSFVTRKAGAAHVVVPLPAARELLRALAAASPGAPELPRIRSTSTDTFRRREIRVRSHDDEREITLVSADPDLARWSMRAAGKLIELRPDDIERAWRAFQPFFPPWP